MAKKKKGVKPKPLVLVFYLGSWILLIIGVLLTTIGGLSFATTGQPITAQSLFEARSLEGIVAVSKEAFSTHILGRPMETVSQTGDARTVIVANFLERYNSPLKPYDYFGKKLATITVLASPV